MSGNVWRFWVYISFFGQDQDKTNMSAVAGRNRKGKADQKSILEQLNAVLPRSGIIFAESDELTHIMCKPKILPLKSITLQKIEEMEKAAFDTVQQTNRDYQWPAADLYATVLALFQMQYCPEQF